MGDWGSEVWESDEAADWFHRFWKEGWTLVQQEIEGFDPAEERFDSVRAAAHVLASFGDPCMAPATTLEALPGWLDKAQEILTAMIDPSREDWGFLDMCDGDAATIASVEEQISALRTRRSAFTAP